MKDLNKQIKKLAEIEAKIAELEKSKAELREQVYEEFVSPLTSESNYLKEDFKPTYECEYGVLSVTRKYAPYQYKSDTLKALKQYKALKARDEAGQDREIIGYSLRVKFK